MDIEFLVSGKLPTYPSPNLTFVTWRAFLKSPENCSGPKTFRGSFRAHFSGFEKRFSKHPIFARYFRESFRDLWREQ